MTIAERIPTSTRGRWEALAGVAAVWVLAYWVNGWLWDRIFYDLFAMAPADRLTQTLHFFFYDTIKIALLLTGIIFVITILRSYMSIERTRAMLGGRREGVGNVMAAGLGVITPFCSCSAVPAFIGFVAAGVPLGVTLSFLIASPLVNEIAIGLLLSLFGFKVTALYIGAGLFIAIVTGWVLGRLRLERWVEPFVFETKLGGQVIDSTAGLTFNLGAHRRIQGRRPAGARHPRPRRVRTDAAGVGQPTLRPPRRLPGGRCAAPQVLTPDEERR